jgi:hypothetical protein
LVTPRTSTFCPASNSATPTSEPAQGPHLLRSRAETRAGLGRLDARGLVVSGHCLGDPARATATGGDLHGAVAVGVVRADLRDAVRRHLDHGHRHAHAVLGEDAGHAGLAPDQSNAHVSNFPVDVHAGREIELHQRIDRLVGRIHDVHQALVGAQLVLIPRVLVDVRRDQHV